MNKLNTITKFGFCIVIAIILLIIDKCSTNTESNSKSILKNKTEEQAFLLGKNNAREMFETGVSTMWEAAKSNNPLYQHRLSMGKQKWNSKNDVEKEMKLSWVDKLDPEDEAVLRKIETSANVTNSVIESYFRGFNSECKKIKRE